MYASVTPSWYYALSMKCLMFSKSTCIWYNQRVFFALKAFSHIFTSYEWWQIGRYSYFEICIYFWKQDFRAFSPKLVSWIEAEANDTVIRKWFLERSTMTIIFTVIHSLFIFFIIIHLLKYSQAKNTILQFMARNIPITENKS